MEKNLYTKFVGIDVSKNKLDVYETSSKKYYEVANTKEAVKELIKTIRKSKKLLVTIDLTGGYERTAVKEFYKAGYNVHRAEGRKVKRFSQSYGEEAKTDKIDAHMLTIYTSKLQDKIRLYKEEDSSEIRGLVKRREDLKEMLQKENNRLENVPDEEVEESIWNIVEVIEKELEKVEEKIKEKIGKNKELREKKEVIESQIGVAEKTSMVLLAELPELGKINRREIAAMVGVAPYPRDSGTIKGYRRTKKGRTIVKKSLYMCALVAIIYDKKMEDFYNSLVAKGKAKMVAIVAVMRKMLIILNSKCKSYYRLNSI